LTLVVALIYTVACGKDSATAPVGNPNDPAAGSFALTSVDARALPFAILSDSFYKLEVTAGTAVLQATGSFIMPLTTRETVAGHASVYVDTTRGTWTQAAGSISLTATPGAVTTNATWDGRHLTVMFEIGPSTNTYVYTKSP
jgi:hypothetical protein